MFVLQQIALKMWRAALFIAENGLFIIKFENLLIKFNSNFAGNYPVIAWNIVSAPFLY